jgi:hypothetical protein
MNKDDFNKPVINEQQTALPTQDPFTIEDHSNLSPPLPMASGNEGASSMIAPDQQQEMFKPIMLGSDRPALPSFTNQSTSGTKYFGGFPEEEYLDKLQYPMRVAEIYDEMRRSDYCIKGLLSSIKNPMRSAEWRVDPFNQDQINIDIAEFVEQCLFYYMRKGFA